MKTLVFTYCFVMFTIGILALSSYTDSGLVTLDTVPPELELISPIGGEAWYIGDTNDILWTATDFSPADNPVSLFYSLSGGTIYHPIISSFPNNGSYPWQMPDTQSYNARVRIVIVDAFGNQTIKNTPSAFSITYVPPEATQGVEVQIVNSSDAVITWLPVTQTIYSTPITPDGYVVLYNETPYEEDQYYYFLGETDQTTHTHQRVARFRSQMFYRIVAYKDYDGRMADIISLGRAKQPLTWADIKTRLGQSDGGAK